MKDRYINDQIEAQEENKESYENIQSAITAASLIGGTFSGVFIILGAFCYPELALLGTIGMGALTCTGLKWKTIFDKEIEGVENIKNHIESLRENTPKATEELNKKRLDKIKVLEKEQEKVDDCAYKANIATIVPVVAEITGAGLTFVNPWLSLIGFAGVAVHAATAAYIVHKYKQDTILENRIKNLKNDLEVIKNDERDQQAERIQSRKIMNPEQTNQNTKQNTSQSEQSVIDYVENLAKQTEEDIEKQKIKK